MEIIIMDIERKKKLIHNIKEKFSDLPYYETESYLNLERQIVKSIQDEIDKQIIEKIVLASKEYKLMKSE